MNYLKHIIVNNPAIHLFNEFEHATDVQKGALLAIMSTRQESVEELASASKYLLKRSIKMHSNQNCIDIVGTGGDGLKTFNISTAASFVIASCGVKVAKHGGRSVSSISGSADVLEELGIPFYEIEESINQSLNKNNYVYLWAPLFNPFLKALAPLRQELGIPTLLNIVGPLINPMRPRRQVVGVYRADLVLKVAKVLQMLGSTNAMVVHSLEGLDELSVSSPTKIAHLENGNIFEYEITPEQVCLKNYPLKEIQGGDPKENAALIKDIFSNKRKGACLDVVLLNAAAGLIVAGCVSNFEEGIEMAKIAITSGATLNLLNQIAQVNV